MSDPIEMAPVLGPPGTRWVVEMFNTASDSDIRFSGYGGFYGISTMGAELALGNVKGYQRINDGIDYVFTRLSYQTARMSPQQDYMVRLRQASNEGIVADVVRSDTLSYVAYLSGNGIAAATDSTVVWSKDGKLMAIPNRLTGFKIYNCPDFTLFSNGLLTTDGKSVDFGGEYFACASNTQVRVYKIENGGLTLVRSHTSSGIQRVAVSPTGEFYAFASSTSVMIYRMDTGASVASFNINTSCNCLLFSPDGEFIYAGTTAATGNLWRRAPSFTDSTAPFNLPSDSLREAYFTSDGKWLVATLGNLTYVYDWQSKQVMLSGLSPNSTGTARGAVVGKFGAAVSNLNGLPVRDSEGNPVPRVKVMRFRRYPSESASLNVPMCSSLVRTDAKGFYEMIGISRSIESFVVFQGTSETENSVILDRVKAK